MTCREPLSVYMQRSLYGPDGYYSGERARFGRAGDFYTSAQASPLYGALWARFILRKVAPEEPLCIVELGCGDGDLAGSLLDDLIRVTAGSGRPIAYAGIDLSPVAQARTRITLEQLLEHHPEEAGRLSFCTATSVAELHRETGERYASGFVIGNEVLDALPCDLIRVSGSRVWRLWVCDREEDAAADQATPGFFSGDRFVTRFISTTDHDLMEYARRYLIPCTDECEVVAAEAQTGILPLVRAVVEHIHPQYLAFIDYGGFTRDIVGADRPEGSLRAFSKHRLVRNWIDSPGEYDLTYDVDFTVLRDALAACGYESVTIRRQGAFLVDTQDFMDVVQSYAAKDPRVLQTVKHIIMPGAMGDRFMVALCEIGMTKEAYSVAK